MVEDLGNLAGESVLNQTGDTAVQQADLALFSSMRSVACWSGTMFALSTDVAWIFGTTYGLQDGDDKRFVWSAAAVVRPGDVAALPEPQTPALALVALGAAAAALRQRR